MSQEKGKEGERGDGEQTVSRPEDQVIFLNKVFDRSEREGRE